MTENPGKILNVAVIGAGEVAMTVHLPTLLLCSHMFKTVALVDISKQTLKHCADKFHVPHVYTDVGQMLSDRPEIDAVMIMNANEYHVRHAVQCLDAGRHVFVEKPMSLTLTGADAIIDAEKRSGKSVFIGYMRRYAEAFLRVKSILHAMSQQDIAYVRVRDIIGVNALTAHQGGCFQKQFTDFPEGSNEERLGLSTEMLKTALGDKFDNPRNHLSWRILNLLGSHDISAMRELFGMPESVLCASRNSEGKFITALLRYPGFIINLELGIDMVRDFDAHIEVFSKDRRIKLQYDNPYIKGLPVTATILSTKEQGDHSVEVIRPTFEDPYTLEFKAWYAALNSGESIKTSAKDAKQDLEIMTMIIEAMV